MNILIPITGPCQWNAFIFPYLQAHVFLFLISLKEKRLFIFLLLLFSSQHRLWCSVQTPQAAVTLRFSSSWDPLKGMASGISLDSQLNEKIDHCPSSKAELIGVFPLKNKNPSWSLPQFLPGEGSGLRVWGFLLLLEPCAWFSGWEWCCGLILFPGEAPIW